jgi:cytochrome c oxidase assembly protein subunit 11
MSSAPVDTANKRGRFRNATLASALVFVALGMVGLSFAAVPLYRLFCEVTGYGGTPQRVEAGAERTLDRTMVVQLDANVAGLSWEFRPETPQVHVRLGETIVVNFIAENSGQSTSVGTATFNVQPDIAGGYFNKIECFCFTDQELQPGERIEMPVQFFVSPDLADDRDLNGTRTITLSYTFFPSAGGGQPVARAESDGDGESL